MSTPAAEVEIELDLVRTLLERQHADLAELSLERVGEGFDNVMYRLGDSLAVRLPRREAGARLIEHEQRWLPRLAPALPIDVPVPVRLGRPDADYPWRWSVLPWLDGDTADAAPAPPGEAPRLGAFLEALHVPAPPDAPRNPLRGVPLEVRRAHVEACLDRLESDTDHVDARIRSVFSDALRAPLDAGDTWLHGDLHPRNVLVHAGRLSGVIDWGDVAAGDRATDLAAIWMHFESRAAREQAIAACGPLSEATLARALGWAVFFGAVLLDTGRDDDPAHAAVGAWTLRRVAADV